MATSATMTFTDQVGKQSTKAITYVNPNATAANVAKYVAGLNALTDNTLDKIKLITRTDITNAAARDPNFTISPDELHVNTIGTTAKEFSARFSGRKRTVTVSGKKPKYTTVSGTLQPNAYNNAQFGTIRIIPPNEIDARYDGDYEAELIFTVAGNDDYDETVAVIKLYGESASEFVDVTASDQVIVD